MRLGSEGQALGRRCWPRVTDRRTGNQGFRSVVVVDSAHGDGATNSSEP